MRPNRRSFIRCAALAAAGNAHRPAPLRCLNALAQSSSDYKALVCVFLYGGNDANNTFIPFDTTGYTTTPASAARSPSRRTSFCRSRPLPNFALNPNLPDIQTLFNNKNAAIVANVGTLVAPTTKAQYQANQSLPSNLFSHPDQQLEWQNAAQSGATPTGWAGRIADTLNTTYNPNGTVPMITSVAGDTLFCNGTSSTPVSVSPRQPRRRRLLRERNRVRRAPRHRAGPAHLRHRPLARPGRRHHHLERLQLLPRSSPPPRSPSTKLQTVFPANNGLAAQLQTDRADHPGPRRPRRQPPDLLRRHRQLRHPLPTSSPYRALCSPQISPPSPPSTRPPQELGVAANVTTFTMSDFSRTFQPNSNTG